MLSRSSYHHAVNVIVAVVAVLSRLNGAVPSVVPWAILVIVATQPVGIVVAADGVLNGKFIVAVWPVASVVCG